MWTALLLGYPFAVYFPRQLECFKKTAVGKFLNNFVYFSITHIAMWSIFFVALVLHPLPGMPSQHKNHHSTTWVCSPPVRQLGMVMRKLAAVLLQAVAASPELASCKLMLQAPPASECLRSQCRLLLAAA